MLVGHDYAVNTDLSVLGVTNLGEPKAGELILICAIAGYTGRSSRCSGSITRVARHPAAEHWGSPGLQMPQRASFLLGTSGPPSLSSISAKIAAIGADLVGPARPWTGPATGSWPPVDHGRLQHGVPVAGARGLGVSSEGAAGFIRPGRPVENAFIEAFNGRLRDECLNVHPVRLDRGRAG